MRVLLHTSSSVDHEATFAVATDYVPFSHASERYVWESVVPSLTSGVYEPDEDSSTDAETCVVRACMSLPMRSAKITVDVSRWIES